MIDLMIKKNKNIHTYALRTYINFGFHTIVTNIITIIIH